MTKASDRTRLVSADRSRPLSRGREDQDADAREEASDQRRLRAIYQGGSMSQLTDRQRDFIPENPYVATATTLRRDGSPHNTIVWIDAEDGSVTFNTAAGRAKPRNLERDSRVSVLVIDREDGYRWLAVRGAAELTPEGADEHIDKLARKYTGQGWRPNAGERRLLVRVRPEHVSAY